MEFIDWGKSKLRPSQGEKIPSLGKNQTRAVARMQEIFTLGNL